MTDTDATNLYTLYGMDISLYTGKARAYLQHSGLPWREVFPTIGTYRKFIIPRTGVRYVPVVQTPDDQVIQDTTEIIDHIEHTTDVRSVYPTDPVQRLVAILLELFGDEWLLIPAMHYRWHYIADNGAELFPQWGRIIAPWAPRPLRALLGKRLSRPFANMLPLLGIHPHSVEAVEASYLRVLDALDQHFAEHEFLFGGRPSIGDFGLIAPLYAHLGRDTYPKAQMQARAPNVYRWVRRMQDGPPGNGDWLAEGAVPEALRPLLACQFEEQIPALLDTAKRLAEWGQGQPSGAKLPRMIGTHRVNIHGVEAERAVIPYSLWMWQRAVDAYAALDAASRERADALLPDTGVSLRTPMQHRVSRENNQLVLA